MRLGPIGGLAHFVGVADACLEIKANPTPATPSSTVEESGFVEEPQMILPGLAVTTTTTSIALNTQSIGIRGDGKQNEEIDWEE